MSGLQFKSEEDLKAWLKETKAAGAEPKTERIGLNEFLEEEADPGTTPEAEEELADEAEADPGAAPEAPERYVSTASRFAFGWVPLYSLLGWMYYWFFTYVSAN